MSQRSLATPGFVSYRALFSLASLRFVLVRVLVGLVVAELAVRILSPEVEFIQKSMFNQDPTVWFRMKPNYTGTMSKKEVPIATNSLGLRDREIGPRRPGVPRILVFGDSLMFGYGVAIEDTATRILEQILRERLGHEVEVVNAAVAGYSTLQAARSFALLANAVKPDIALLAFGVLNGGRMNVTFSEQNRRTARMTEGSAEHRVQQFIKGKIQWLRDTSQLSLLVKRRMAPRRELSGMDVHAVDVSPQDEAGLRLIEQSIKEFAQATAQHGVRSGVVIIPSHKQVDPKLWQEMLLKHNLPGALYAPDQPDKRLQDYARKEAIPVLDLRAPIAARALDGFYWDGDGEHWEPHGHRIVAEILADYLVQAGFLATGQH